MTLAELLRFTGRVSGWLTKRYGNQTPVEARLSRTVKIGEEYGELCNEVMAANGEQRPEKLSARAETALGDEVADVLITTLLLAQSCDVDVEAALVRRIETITSRLDAPAPGGDTP